MTPELIKDLNDIYAHFGECIELEKLSEECKEYVEAYDYKEVNIYEEIADVFICAMQLYLNIYEIQLQVEIKIARTKKRISEGYYD